MLGDLITIGLLVYVIGFYIWKYWKLNELKTQYPVFLSDGKGIEHYYISSWHYVKNKKTVALYESPNLGHKDSKQRVCYISLNQSELNTFRFPSRTIARAFESTLHKTYNPKHLRGEWFDLSDDEVNEVIQALK